MRFEKGVHYPHPPRGSARRPYHVSEAARRARRRNLSRCRLRSNRESWVIKLLIWQSCFDGRNSLSQRALARQLGVYPSYVCKVRHQSASGLDALASGTRATFDDLEEARRFTAKLTEQKAGPAARAAQSSYSGRPRAMDVDETIAARWREVEEWKRKNLRYRAF